MTRTLAAIALVALTVGPAAAQPAVTGTYSLFWTDAANVPITSASVPQGQNLTARLWVRETGGNVFTGDRTTTSGPFAGQMVGGLGGFDSIFSVAAGGTGLIRLTPPNPVVTNQRYANVSANPQFASTAGGYFQQNVAQFNSTGTSASFNSLAGSPSQPATYVKDTAAPNVPGSIYLYQITFETGFAGSTGGTTTLTGRQGNGNNFGYYTGTTYATIDSLVGPASADLQVQVVPVPEPAAALGLAAAGLGLVRLARRRGFGRRSGLDRRASF